MVPTIIALIIFAVYDYFGYNIVDKTIPAKIYAYRVQQNVFLILLGVLLWVLFGLREMFALGILWWTFNADLLYYAIGEIKNGFGTTWLPGRGIFKEVLEGKVTWIGWTPFGLLFGYGKTKAMPAWLVFLQALAGILLAYLILTLWNATGMPGDDLGAPPSGDL